MRLVGIVVTATGGLAQALPFPTEHLAEPSKWDAEEFKAAFEPSASTTPLAWKRWPGEVTIWDVPLHSINARFNEGRIDTITLLFLDAGTHFGYVPRDQAEAVRAENHEKFRELFLQQAATVREGLTKFAGKPAEPFTLGKSAMLRQEAALFPCGEAFGRLQVADEQLIKVSFHRDRESAMGWIDSAFRAMPLRSRAEAWKSKVVTLENGDRVITSVPLLPQGDRAYCGVSALAMTLQTLGSNIDTEELAAAAGIRYGSTRGSKIREMMDDAAAEAGLKLSRATRFDYQRVKASIDAGVPVVVWRRFSEERDYLHTQFARRLREDPIAVLPAADAADRSTWPDKEAYAHASVITGYHPGRKEIIFTESWSEAMRGRRMRIEEMEGTCYYQFVLRW